MNKQTFTAVVLFVLPFLVMILINEISRYRMGKDYHVHGITTINSSFKLNDQCTWECHDNTIHCKSNHLKFSNANTEYTDKVFFGIIGILGSTGDYRLANIIFLVVMMPLLIWYLLIRSIQMQEEIIRLKKHSGLK